MQTEIKQGENIFNFKKGDIVIKVKPSFYNGITNNSFMFEPHEIIEIKNSTIYLERKKGYAIGEIFEANLYEHSENWIKYEPLTHEESLNFKEFMKFQIGNWFFDDNELEATKATLKGFLHKLYLYDNDFFSKEQIEEILKNE